MKYTTPTVSTTSNVEISLYSACGTFNCSTLWWTCTGGFSCTKYNK